MRTHSSSKQAGSPPLAIAALLLAAASSSQYNGHLSGLDGFVDLGSRKCEGEVDKFERQCNCPIFFADFPSGMLGYIVAAENTQGSVHIEMAGSHHDGLGRWVLGSLSEPVL